MHYFAFQKELCFVTTRILPEQETLFIEKEQNLSFVLITLPGTNSSDLNRNS